MFGVLSLCVCVSVCVCDKGASKQTSRTKSKSRCLHHKCWFGVVLSLQLSAAWPRVIAERSSILASWVTRCQVKQGEEWKMHLLTSITKVNFLEVTSWSTCNMHRLWIQMADRYCTSNEYWPLQQLSWLTFTYQFTMHVLISFTKTFQAACSRAGALREFFTYIHNSPPNRTHQLPAVIGLRRCPEATEAVAELAYFHNLILVSVTPIIMYAWSKTIIAHLFSIVVLYIVSQWTEIWWQVSLPLPAVTIGGPPG